MCHHHFCYYFLFKRYNNYIVNGIDSDNVSTFDSALEKDVKELINPYLLSSYENLVEDILEFIKDEYLFIQKKISGMHVVYLLHKTLNKFSNES
jgi:hypothetical protein